MAVAWAVSMCYIKLPEATIAYFEKNSLDDFTETDDLLKMR